MSRDEVKKVVGSTMDIIIGKDKFPLIKFDNNKYANILPVTKYQFERYIWEMAPKIVYDESLNKNPRVTPIELTKKNIKQLLITNVSFKEASDFAKWIGGRLPAKNELLSLNKYLSEIRVESLIDITASRKKYIDARWFGFLNNLSHVNVTITELFRNVQMEELCSNSAFIPESELWLRNLNGDHYSSLVGESLMEVRGEFGFRVIITQGDN